jgi:two-component system, chemotaxis family, chemotaxis protein CheY
MGGVCRGCFTAEPAMHTQPTPSVATKRVALIGHCGPDSSYLRLAVAKVGREVQVLSADDDAGLKRLLDEGVDLLLLNRQLDYGFDETEGVGLIKKLRQHYPNVKTMLVSNYPDAQAAAVAAGALPGFGKRELGSPRVAELIRDALA